MRRDFKLELLETLVLALINKGGSFGYFYTLHQIIMRTDLEISLDRVIEKLLELKYISFENKGEGKKWYYLNDQALDLVTDLTSEMLDIFEKREGVNLSFIKSLLFKE